MSHSRKVISIHELKVSCGDCSLSEICLPHGLNQEELNELDALILHKPRIEQGEVLFRSGDPMHHLYAVRSGAFKAVLSSNEGAEQITGFYLSGELMGLDGFGDDVHQCTMVALETSTVCAIDIDELEKLSTRAPGLRRQLRHLIGAEINHDHRNLLALGQLKGEERLAAFLLNISRRLKKRGFSPYEFNLPMARHDLANYLGLAVETLSRMFSRMIDADLIETNRRHVKLLNTKALCELAQYDCPRESHHASS